MGDDRQQDIRLTGTTAGSEQREKDGPGRCGAIPTRIAAIPPAARGCRARNLHCVSSGRTEPNNVKYGSACPPDLDIQCNAKNCSHNSSALDSHSYLTWSSAQVYTSWSIHTSCACQRSQRLVTSAFGQLTTLHLRPSSPVRSKRPGSQQENYWHTYELLLSLETCIFWSSSKFACADLNISSYRRPHPQFPFYLSCPFRSVW